MMGSCWLREEVSSASHRYRRVKEAPARVPLAEGDSSLAGTHKAHPATTSPCQNRGASPRHGNSPTPRRSSCGEPVLGRRLHPEQGSDGACL